MVDSPTSDDDLKSGKPKLDPESRPNHNAHVSSCSDDTNTIDKKPKIDQETTKTDGDGAQTKLDHVYGPGPDESEPPNGSSQKLNKQGEFCTEPQILPQNVVGKSTPSPSYELMEVDQHSIHSDHEHQATESKSHHNLKTVDCKVDDPPHQSTEPGENVALAAFVGIPSTTDSTPTGHGEHKSSTRRVKPQSQRHGLLLHQGMVLLPSSAPPQLSIATATMVEPGNLSGESVASPVMSGPVHAASKHLSDLAAPLVPHDGTTSIPSQSSSIQVQGSGRGTEGHELCTSDAQTITPKMTPAHVFSDTASAVVKPWHNDETPTVSAAPTSTHDAFTCSTTGHTEPAGSRPHQRGASSLFESLF